MKKIFLILFFPAFLFSSSFYVVLPAQVVHAGLQGALLANFNAEVGFAQRVIGHQLTPDQLVYIVSESLREYQERSVPVILPVHELRKHILKNLLKQHPDAVALLRRKNFLP